jgi:cystathionine beta-lyase family protein involved in aluminum resistance
VVCIPRAESGEGRADFYQGELNQWGGGGVVHLVGYVLGRNGYRNPRNRELTAGIMVLTKNS